jgi:hypothetical protein
MVCESAADLAIALRHVDRCACPLTGRTAQIIIAGKPDSFLEHTK